MEFRQLSHFVAVAEERSFTRAAQRVNIVQSGISTSIAGLERELGVVLFVRGTHHVDLTEAGRALLVQARHALSAVAAAKAAVHHNNGLGGTLTIGVIATLPPEVGLSAVLQQFHAAHREVVVRIREIQSPLQIFDTLRAGEIDLAFTAVHAPPGFTTINLGRFPMQLVCGTRHPLAHRRSVKLDAIEGESFIDVPVGWLTRTLVDRACEDAGIQRRAAFDVNQVALILRMVEAGMGITILPNVVRQFDAEVSFVDFRPALGHWEISLAHAGTEPANAAAKAFLDLALAQWTTRPQGKRAKSNATTPERDVLNQIHLPKARVPENAFD